MPKKQTEQNNSILTTESLIRSLSKIDIYYPSRMSSETGSREPSYSPN